MRISQKLKIRWAMKLKWIMVVAIGLSFVTVEDTIIVSAQNKKPSFEFGLVTDVQFCDCDASRTRFYRASVDKLTDAVQTFNQHNLAFTIQLGDIIDRNVFSFSTILPIYNEVKGPKYHVLGNHDFPVKTDEVMSILGMTKPYYDFSQQGWRFVVLDTNDISFYANEEGSAKYQQAMEIYQYLKWSGAINAHTWNSSVGQEQMTWFHGVLSDAAQKGEKVVVFAHMPVFPWARYNVWNDFALVQEMEAAGNVVAYFNGHHHAGNFAEKNGIYYVNFKGMVETADTNAYSIIQVYSDRIEIDGYGREQDRVLQIQK